MVNTKKIILEMSLFKYWQTLTCTYDFFKEINVKTSIYIYLIKIKIYI